MKAEAPAATAEILLLEQNSEQAALLTEAVENSTLSIVTDCASVISFLRRSGLYSSAPRPNIILLDLDLSRTEDCETLTDIKKDAQLKRIPVVVLASSTSYADVFQAYDLHANAYICKPADREEFIRVIRATLHFWLALARLPRD